jgi:Fic family protein
MITFERKTINNKPFYYLTEQIRLGTTYKKIQVFVGKNIPKDTSVYFNVLKDKETALLRTQLATRVSAKQYLSPQLLLGIEKSRVDLKYHVAQLNSSEYDRLVRLFAINFIFESNAIEGSRLSQNEVSKIVSNQYIKKNTPKNEVQEVLNAIEAFTYITSHKFLLTQKNIKHLHTLVTRELDIPTGYKKQHIIVNNKETTEPKHVRKELSELLTWYKKTKNSEHPFVRAIIFHNRFEYIHPFIDGNGRTGRLILNAMLLHSGYGFILFRNSNKIAYMSALNKGDEGRYRNILTLSKRTYQKTIQEIITIKK